MGKSHSRSRSPSPVRDNAVDDDDRQYPKDQEEDDVNRNDEGYDNEN